MLHAFIVVTNSHLAHLLIKCRVCPSCMRFKMRLLRKFAVLLS